MQRARLDVALGRASVFVLRGVRRIIVEREYHIMSKINESSISRRSLIQVAAGAAVAAAAAGVAIEAAAPEQAFAAGKKKRSQDCRFR